MPFCANDECPNYVATGTRGEFVDGIFKCSDCGSVLVAQAPPVVEEKAQWVLLDRFTTSSEAHMAQNLLESEGIPATLADDHLNEINPLLAPAIGWVRLFVPAELEQQARELLAQDESSNVDGMVREKPDAFRSAVALGDRGPERPRASRRATPTWVWLLLVVMALVAGRMAFWRGE